MSNLFTNELKDEIILLEIRNKIEQVRQELNGMLSNHVEKGFNNEIIEMSQYLDRLLVSYIYNLGREKNE